MPCAEWVKPIAGMVERRGYRGGLLVIFPDYRPDLFTALAHGLGLSLFDYRDEVMSSLGWGADRLGLEELDATLHNRATEGGTLVHNVEALLSTKSADETRRWMRRFLDTDWLNTLLVPIVVNADQVPEAHPGVYRIRAESLEEQPFLNRLRF